MRTYSFITAIALVPLMFFPIVEAQLTCLALDTDHSPTLIREICIPGEVELIPDEEIAPMIAHEEDFILAEDIIPASAPILIPQFDEDNLTQPSNLTLEQVQYILADTELHGCSEAYLDAEHTYGVSASFLIALTANESGWGESSLAQNKNNISSYMAYNGQESRAKTFNSFSDCIDVTAEMLSRAYLRTDGKFYNGKNLSGVNVKYAQNNDGSPNTIWADNIACIANDIIEKARTMP